MIREDQRKVNLIYAQPAIPAEESWIAERGFSAGSVCDECIAEATDEEQNEADGNPQPASLQSSAGMADAQQSCYRSIRPTRQSRQWIGGRKRY